MAGINFSRMFDAETINILGIASSLTIISLTTVLFFKMRQLKQIKVQAESLRRSLDEMDEQAKLIVRTDMELNKTQEELDKKVSGLYALQQVSRAVSVSLEENQIFKRIETNFLEELGFEKALIFLWSEEDKKFTLRLNIGYAQESLKLIQEFLEANREVFLHIIRNEKTASSLSGLITSREKINRLFKANSFLISPLLPKEGEKGVLFVGTEKLDVPITEGDEELVTILANQLGQALENARLFEKTWKGQQELGKKVEERTRELSQALEEVKKISKRKTDFVSSVSHELRTPLTSIKGYASILLTAKLGDIPDPVRERLDKINRHSDELVHMVNDLLDISRIESGKMTMKQEPMQLREALEKVADLLGGQLKDHGIEFSFNIPDNANTVFADRTQAERIFINLIGNALKFTPAAGKISVYSYKEDHMVRVDVTDTGCGIPASAQEAIFDEFYRVDNPINENVKGTGLGLALVKHIVEAHKGKIWVRSKEGVGSTFSFTLPQPE